MASVESQKFMVSEVVIWFDVAFLPLTSSSSTSSWLFTVMFFRTVNKHFPLALVRKVLKYPVWCGLLVEFLVGFKRTWGCLLVCCLRSWQITSSNSASQMLSNIG